MNRPGLTAAFAAALFAPIEARNLGLPQATGAVELPLDGWTPMPTAAPGALHRFARRDDTTATGDTMVLVAPDNICGYISGRPGAGYSCYDEDYTCLFVTATSTYKGNVACCDSERENCGIRATCIDYEAYYSSSACDNGCDVDAYTLKCTESSLPYCNTISFSSDIYDFWCNDVDIKTAQAATTKYKGGPDRSFSPSPLTADVTSSMISNTDAGAPGFTGSVAPTSTGGSDGGDGNSDNDNDDNKDEDKGKDDDDDDGGGAPVGPIVGGVVGGVAAIGLGGLGLFLFFRKKKQKQAASNQPSPAVAYAPVQQQGPPPPGMAPSPGQPYDPKFAAAGGQYGQYPPQQQAGGFYPMSTASPPPHSASSPAMSHMDPNISASSPNTSVYGGGYAQQPPQQPQANLVHEAPARPEETHRGGVHELA